MRAWVVALMLGCGCTADQSPAAVRRSTVAFVEGASRGRASGGFAETTFVVRRGEPLLAFAGCPDRGEVAAADGYRVLPAFAEGAPAAFVVSELWENHPAPWVQPVYAFMTGEPPTTGIQVSVYA
jgi:hypothetical protein